MEFRTGELEATLNRKEQMIATLQKDLEEVRSTPLHDEIISFSLICQGNRSSPNPKS